MAQGEEKKSRVRVVLTIVLYSIVVVVISGIIYVTLEQIELESTDEEDFKIGLHYIAKTENGSYMLGIHAQDSSKHNLNRVKIRVFKEVNGTNETIYNDELLSSVKVNPQNASLDDEVIYYDLDEDDTVSTGDLIFIWIDPLMPGNYTVEMNTVLDEAIVEGTFTAY
jgi:hypothetical protein